jgi:hypothetical protein
MEQKLSLNAENSSAIKKIAHFMELEVLIQRSYEPITNPVLYIYLKIK